MTLEARAAPLLTALLLAMAIAACGGGNGGSNATLAPGTSPSAGATASPTTTGGTTGATPTRPVDQTGRVFDQSVVHSVELQVPQASLPVLVPGGDERVKARLVFDGTVVEDVGLRLKGGEGSASPLTAKPGFSVDTDAFAKDRSLLGVTRFTLGNEIRDPSFVTETVVYEVFRRAGIVAPRTALATVKFNGETFGLYVLREGYDKNFLRRTFPDPNGNLYEGSFGIDVTNAQGMDAKTNEKSDRADLKAVSRVVAETPEPAFFEAIGRLVDLDELATYWAVEAICDHWDGYIQPNNYYVYGDPSTGKLVFMAHGADWSMTDPLYPVFQYPGEKARLGSRLWDNQPFHAKLAARIAEVLDRAWDPAALLALMDRQAALVRATGLGGTRETHTMVAFETALAERKAFVTGRAATVRAQLAQR